MSWKEKKQQEQEKRYAEKAVRRAEVVSRLTPDELEAYDQRHCEFKREKMEERRTEVGM